MSQPSSLYFVYPPAGEAPCSPQRPNAPGGGGQTAGQRETETPVCCPGQHHRTLDSNQDGGTVLDRQRSTRNCSLTCVTCVRFDMKESPKYNKKLKYIFLGHWSIKALETFYKAMMSLLILVVK